MEHRPAFRTTWLPLVLAAIALVILNLGLYTRLASQPTVPLFQIPYTEDFSTLSDLPYETFSGDWEIRDQSLVQLSTSGFDLSTFIPLDISPEEPYVFETTMRFLGGSMGGGLIFNAQTRSRQQNHMVRFNVDGGRMWLIYGYFNDESNFMGQGSVGLDIAPDDASPHRMQVKVENGTYAIGLDGVELATGIPLQYTGGSPGFISAMSQVSFDDIVIDNPSLSVVQPDDIVPTTEPAASVPQPTAVPANVASSEIEGQALLVEDFSDPTGATSLWVPISGEWVLSDGNLIQQQTSGFDLSNIYTVPLSNPVGMQISFSHLEGAGGGAVFNLPQPDSKAGGHMVRYMDADGTIAWGYFDSEGVFNGQGSARVAPPSNTAHSLEILEFDDTYSLRLDGIELASGVPLQNQNTQSYIGLTASQSRVAFSNVNLWHGGSSTSGTGTNSTVIDTVGGLPDINTEAATGTWVSDGNTITQTDAALTDYIAGTGLAGVWFSISTDILLPEGRTDTGAGLIFHMDGRDDPRLGYMVRFSDGGQILFWGRYDAEGVFKGEGSVSVEIEPGVPGNLSLVVRDTSYDIYVDNVQTVENIPIDRTDGWIGIISFSGPVAFSNIRMELGD